MSSLARPSAVAWFAGILPGATLLLGLAGWPYADRTLELCGVLVAAILLSAYKPRRGSVGEGDIMQPSFVAEFGALVMVGLPLALAVSAAAEIAHGLAQAPRRRRVLDLCVHLVTALLAMESAGAVFNVTGGTVGDFLWPWHVLPVAAAAGAYCVVRSTAVRFVLPLARRAKVEADWSARAARTWPPYALGATIAVALAEVVAHRRWELLPAICVPLYFACLAYCGSLDSIEEEHRRREVIDSLVQGMAVVNSIGELTLWSDVLERMVGLVRSQALGRSLGEAMPALTKTELPQAVAEVLASGTPRTVSRIGITLGSGARLLTVHVLPVDGGATLLWLDVTASVREDAAAGRAGARLALAAESASEGLWEWDLRTQECFFSGRWRAIVGLPAEAGPGHPTDWLARVHGDDVRSLKEAIRGHIAGDTEILQHEHRLRHEDGSYRWVSCRGVAVAGAGGRPGRLAGALAARLDAPIREAHAGLIDSLTGLANRTVFVERLGRRLTELQRRPDSDRFAVLYLDLDRFKVVNDSLGHLVGDELLSVVSRRLEQCLRPSDVLARLGGDEFAVLLSSLSSEAQANTVAFRIQEALSTPFAIGGREVFTTASIGIALSFPHYSTPDEIMRDADTAMYHAKTSGKARHELFDADMHARVRDRLGLESDLRHAVSNNAFEVHYQPIVLLDTGMCVGFESLIRWQRNGEAVSPATFIPLAEELGLIEPLGTWVLRQACQTFARWQRRYPGRLDYITVNVSSRQLVHQNFLSVVEKAVEDARLEPSQLRLEITETALMENPNGAAQLLRDLRDFGVKIYLDDFGTGYSSLSHLHRLPVDALKIDRSFVKSLLHADRPAIVESILALAHTLNTNVVAEGIESDVQAIELERLGCTHAQGYLFSKPLPVAAVEELLACGNALGPKGRVVVPPEAAERGVFGVSAPLAWPEGAPGEAAAAAEATLTMTRALANLRPAG
jgi:diguanylate cyclase (GGDEF)-like protein/PAS domain S-box-containing protein